MALIEPQERGLPRVREAVRSDGHPTPRFMDRSIPSWERRIFAEGGPGKTFPGASGTNPWTLGTLMIGSGQVFELTYFRFQTGSANAFFKLRHSNSGSNSANPGGTLQSWHLPSVGLQEAAVEPESPIRSIRGPGTLSLLGFGAGSSGANHRALPTTAATRFSGLVRGYVH